MRELKFRAWSEETKSFECFDLYEGTECGLTNLQIWARDTQIEQYTGLKDKNGKEIYEGDIVEAPIYGVWTTGNSDAIFGDKIWELLVIWSDAGCGFLFKVIGSKNQPNRVYDILDEHLGAFEVIGNIHEDADLLEDGK